MENGKISRFYRNQFISESQRYYEVAQQMPKRERINFLKKFRLEPTPRKETKLLHLSQTLRQTAKKQMVIFLLQIIFSFGAFQLLFLSPKLSSFESAKRKYTLQGLLMWKENLYCNISIDFMSVWHHFFLSSTSCVQNIDLLMLETKHYQFISQKSVGTLIVFRFFNSKYWKGRFCSFNFKFTCFL